MLVSSSVALHLTLTNISLTTFLHISPPEVKDVLTLVGHILYPIGVTFTKYSDFPFNILYMKMLYTEKCCQYNYASIYVGHNQILQLLNDR